MTLEILAKGLTARGKFKEQWKEKGRVCFCQIVTTIIKTFMNSATKTFQNTAREATLYSNNTFVKDMVYTQAFHTQNFCADLKDKNL